MDSIFIVGEFSQGSLGDSYRRAFEAIGVQTHTAALGDLRQQLGWVVRNRWTHRLTIGNYFIRDHASRAMNRKLEETIIESGASAVLVLSLAHFFADIFRNLQRRGIKVVSFYPDNPFPPYYNARPETLPAARASDLCLVWSEKLVDQLRNAGVPHPGFLPFGWDPEVFPYCESQPQGVWPGALFVGGWDREREEFLEEIASHVPLRIYGPVYWGTRAKPGSRVRTCWQKTDLRLAEAARIIRESAACLNILRTQHIIQGSPDALIMRHFEVPGAGGFLLSTRSGGATRLFPEGESAEYFSGTAECVEKIQYYIAHTDERRRIADHAHAIVSSAHQYTDRAREIVEMLHQATSRSEAES